MLILNNLNWTLDCIDLPWPRITVSVCLTGESQGEEGDWECHKANRPSVQL